MKRRELLASALSAIVGIAVKPKTSSGQELFNMTLIRTFESDKCISGELFVNRQFICHTLELPWQGNKPNVSAIPEDEYGGALRYDKSDQWRIQLLDTDPRTGIEIHIGNYTSEIKGCILTGSAVENALARVTESGRAYSKLKNTFYGTDNPVMTPNKTISLRVRFNVKPTEFILRDEQAGLDAVYRQDGTNWLLYSNTQDGRHVWNEVIRTDQHIMFQGAAGSGVWQNRQIRLALHGGGQMEVRRIGRNDWQVFAEGTKVIRRDLTSEI
jgi:hypothetical protein